MNTIPIQEAKDPSEIENIVTTSDALYKADVEKEKKIDQTTKEVQRYTIALNEGFDRIKEDGILRIIDIISIQKEIEDNDAGIRSLPGTKLLNPVTGEVVFVPPQRRDNIQKALDNLAQFINNDEHEASNQEQILFLQSGFNQSYISSSLLENQSSDEGVKR